MWIGIQSGCDTIRKEYFNRYTPTNKIIEGAQIIRALDIPIIYDLISDNPWETDEQRLETLELLLNLPDPVILNQFSMAYLPRTVCTSRALREGIIEKRQIEGNTDKTAKEWLSTLEYNRSNRDLFWLVMYGLTQFKLFSKERLKCMGKSQFWMKHPQLLLTYIKLLSIIKRKKVLTSA